MQTLALGIVWFTRCLSIAQDLPELELTFLSRRALQLRGGGVSSMEGGVVLRTEDGYAMFTTDTTHGAVATRLVYYEASEPDGPFTFGGVLACCSSGVVDGTDNRASLWAPMPSFDGKTWHLFYVQYASAPNNSSGWYVNFHGEIMHGISSSGMGGPYTDVGIVLRPDEQSQDWEGLQGTDSISPPFRLANGSFAAFYGSAHSELPAPSPYRRPHMWNNGLVLADALGDAFRRVTPSSLVNLNGGQSENPIVTYAPSYGLYVAVFDYLSDEGQGFGISTSRDGLTWSASHIVGVPGGVRTPQGFILESDDTASLFYTSGQPESPWRATFKMRASPSIVV